MKQKKRKTQNKHALIPAPVILAAVILLCFAGITSARYVLQKENSTVAEAEEFYFESDFLKEESEKAVYYMDPETTEFTIQLFNYADSKRITAGKIQYEITVDGGTCVKGQNSGSFGGSSAETAKIQIAPDDSANAERTITVTAQSTSPYSKTLKAEFIMKFGNQFTIEDTAGNRAASLTMICADAGKTIAIHLPEGVIPDGADDRVTYDSNTRTCGFQSEGHGIYSLVLLKKDKDKVLTGQENGIFADSITIQ